MDSQCHAGKEMAIEAMDCTLSGAMREQDKPVTMAKKATASVLVQEYHPHAKLLLSLFIVFHSRTPV